MLFAYLLHLLFRLTLTDKLKRNSIYRKPNSSVVNNNNIISINNNSNMYSKNASKKNLMSVQLVPVNEETISIHSKQTSNFDDRISILSDNTKKQAGTPSVLSDKYNIEWVKLESFSFPKKSQTINYENLRGLFKVLYNEYITKNGIVENNQVIFKLQIEKLIDKYASLQDNPISVLINEFEILNTVINKKEDFLNKE